MENLPHHLQKYVVEQDYSRYTPVDQAVWRYILRQLRGFLSEHAHPIYAEGLARSGITVDSIPHIEKMSESLEKFGWRAVPVSGFIPPAAFMEMQSLGYLPIASDMRSLEHLAYTPAPDIVHEAAGHAPILVDSEFAHYLKRYAQVAKKAILFKHDLDQYSAIRALSDLKEDPDATEEELVDAEAHLQEINASITEISEAAELGRMNWWTAEYGLIGSLEKPKIFGAGLLSSVGEAKSCLSPSVRKIPLTIDCIKVAYDITEKQPQLFVTPSFAHLGEVLDQLAAQMAFKVGGMAGLEKAQRSEAVNTAVLNSGLQISGVLSRIRTHAGSPSYLHFTGPCQLGLEDGQIPGHSRNYHAHGFGTPIGRLNRQSKCLSEMADSELQALGLRMGQALKWQYESGVEVEGQVMGWTKNAQGQLVLVSLEKATAKLNGEILFAPEWGTLDIGIGSQVTSVFGGPCDRTEYGDMDDFFAERVPSKNYSLQQKEIHTLYQSLKLAREKALKNHALTSEWDLAYSALKKFPAEWLAWLEALEIVSSLKATLDGGHALEADFIEKHLGLLKNQHPSWSQQIADGMALAPLP